MVQEFVNKIAQALELPDKNACQELRDAPRIDEGTGSESWMLMESCFYYQTDIGRIAIAENGNALTRLSFEEMEGIRLVETPLLSEAGAQLREYLAGRRRTFTVPLEPKGTAFMQSVWEALGAIPYGETCSYQQVAQQIGRPKASRAVGMANHRNPIPILIPCHRVIAATGHLNGYLGGVPIKAHLLDLEKRNVVV